MGRPITLPTKMGNLDQIWYNSFVFWETRPGGLVLLNIGGSRCSPGVQMNPYIYIYLFIYLFDHPKINFKLPRPKIFLSLS